MSNNAQQLTIFLTLKDRASYTKRWLAHAEEFQCPFPILIADGSTTDENEHFVKPYLSKLNIAYHRYPEDKTHEIYYDKVADAVKKIKTPFLIKVNNDDLYDFSALSEGALLLQKSDKYHSCFIKKVNFTIKQPALILHHPSLHVVEQRQSPLERLSLYFSGSPGAYYNIHRTDFYVAFWQDVLDLRFNSMRGHEMLLNTMSYLSGNIATTTLPGYFREDSGQGNTCQIESNTLKEIMNPTWIADHQKISNYLADFLIDKEKASRDDIIQFYFDGIRNFLSTSVVSHLLQDPVLTDNYRKNIRILVLKNIISNSKYNKIIRKIYEIKNRLRKKENTFLAVYHFLKKWHKKNAENFK